MKRVSIKSYRKSLNLKISILRFLGFWSLNTSTSVHTRLLHQISHFTAILLVITYISSVITDLVVHKDNFSIIVEDALFLVTLFMVVFKMYIFKSKNNQIIVLTKKIYKSIDILCESSDTTIVELMRKTIFYENINDKFYASVAFMFDLTLFSTILLNFGELPVRGTFPFDVSVLPFYILAVIIQFGTAGITLTLVVIMDGVLFSFVRWINLQLRVLVLNYKKSDTFHSVMADGSLKSEVQLNLLGRVCEHIKDDLTAYRLKVQFKKHWYLAGIVAEFNSIFNSTMLMQVFTGCFMICLGGLQVLIGELKTQLTILFFLGAAGFQLFSCCWFGSELIFVSNSVSGGLWLSSWEEDLTFNVKSTMMIAMALAKKPLQLKAGKFFVMSLETFVLVLRNAYSFLVLLSTLNTD